MPETIRVAAPQNREANRREQKQSSDKSSDEGQGNVPALIKLCHIDTDAAMAEAWMAVGGLGGS